MIATFFDTIKDKGQRASELIESLKDNEKWNTMATKTRDGVEKGVFLAIDKLFEGQTPPISNELKILMSQKVLGSKNREVLATVRYINGVVAQTLPRTVADLKCFRQNLCKKLIEDAISEGTQES